MFYPNEVGRATLQVAAEEANATELGLAKMLVGVLEAKFEPEKWKDRYEERLKALIESRTPVAADSRQSEPKPAPAADIMEALRKSLELARKPVGREQQPAKPKRQSARRSSTSPSISVAAVSASGNNAEAGPGDPRGPASSPPRAPLYRRTRR
jgi:DNA end-binding protein Ku